MTVLSKLAGVTLVRFVVPLREPEASRMKYMREAAWHSPCLRGLSYSNSRGKKINMNV